MHNPQTMQICNSTRHLRNVISHNRFLQGGESNKLIVQIALAHFHHQINLVFADVVAVGWEDVGVVAEHVDFYLVYQKLQVQLLFLEGFDGCHQAGYVRCSLDDLTGLTFCNWLQHSELYVLLFGRTMLPHHFKSLAQIVLHFYWLLPLLPEKFLGVVVQFEVVPMVVGFLLELLYFLQRPCWHNLGLYISGLLPASQTGRGLGIGRPGFNRYFYFKIIAGLVGRWTGIPNPHAHNRRFPHLYVPIFLIDVFHLVDGLLGFGPEFDEILEGGFGFAIGMGVISFHSFY